MPVVEAIHYENCLLAVIRAGSSMAVIERHNPGRAADAAYSKGCDLFSDLRFRPQAASLLGVRDSEIVAKAKAAGLPINEQFFPGYIHNLIGVLPYYRSVVGQLVNRIRLGHRVICLGRDFDLVHDALLTAVAGSGAAARVIHLPISGRLRDELPYDSPKTRRFLDQYIDFKGLADGSQRYTVADTGFMGTTIDWINCVALHAASKDPTKTCERPVKGILVRTQGRPIGILGGEYTEPIYPQFKLRSRGYAAGDFILPAELVGEKSPDINYAVAAATQLMPKHYGHVSRIVSIDGKLQPVADISDGAHYALAPVETISLQPESKRILNLRVDWQVAIDPVAATRIQAFVVNYFARTRSSFPTGVRAAASGACDEFRGHFASLFRADLSPVARRYVAAKESGFDAALGSVRTCDALPGEAKLLAQVNDAIGTDGILARTPTLDAFVALNRARPTIEMIRESNGTPYNELGWFLYSAWGEPFVEYLSVCSAIRNRIKLYSGREDQFPSDLRSSIETDLGIMRNRLAALTSMSVYDYYLERRQDPAYGLRQAGWPQ